MEKFVLHIIKINVLAAAGILLVMILSRWVKRKYSVRWRYYIWLFISLFLLLPVDFTRENAVVDFKFQVEADSMPHGNAAGTQPDPAADTPDTRTLGQEGEDIALNSVSPKTRKSALTAAEISGLFCVVWAAGCFLLAVCSVVMYRVSMSRLKRWGIVKTGCDSFQLYRKVCGEYCLKKQPKLMLNPMLKTPVLAGITGTCLYLPDRDYSEKELELIFRHELEHYKHRDLWYKMFLMAVSTIYWFNPFLWLVRKEAEKDIEYLCDSKVTEKCSHAECMLYNRLLLKTASGRTDIHYLTAGLNDGTSALKERIVYMMSAKKLKKGILPVALVALILVGSNLLVGCSVDAVSTKESKGQAASGDEKSAAQDTEAVDIPENRQTPNVTNRTEDTPTPENTVIPKSAVTPEAVMPNDPEEPAESKEAEEPQASREGSGDDAGSKAVNAAVRLYEVDYLESKAYTGLEFETYYKVGISNISNTSFDFDIYNVTAMTGESELVFRTHTAEFTGDGTSAVFKGQDYTLVFTFPNYHQAAPDVTDMEISGFSPVEGLTFSYNGVPGHEFS